MLSSVFMLSSVLNGSQWKRCVSFFLVLSLFFVPISSTLKSIFVVLSAGGILLTPTYRRDLSFVFSQPWCKAAIAFFLVVLVACLWSHADYRTCFVFIEKYSKLLYLPIFVIGFRRQKVRHMGIYAFLLAMTITCVFSLFNHSEDPGLVLFHNHIVTAYMMAFAAYLSGLLVFRQPSHFRTILFFLLTILLSYQVLFVNTGRSGYVLYFVLMVMLLIQSFSAKHVAAVVLCFCSLFALCSYQSTVISNRFHSTVEDLNNYQHGKKDTPIGYRFVFHHYAKSLFVSSPWIGQGTGGFAHAFRHDNATGYWKNLLDPHSQYWLIAADFGLLGLVALFYFFGTLVRAACRLGEMKPVMLGLLVSFFIANVSDSLFFYSAVGYLFILFSALCLGELLESRETSAVKISTEPLYR